MFRDGKKLGCGSTLIISALCLAEPAPVIAAKTVTTQIVPSVIETANFRLVGVSAEVDTAWIGRELEAQRRRLCDTWLGYEPSPWSPKCHVVVHASAAGYVRAVGSNAFATLGATTIDFARGKISRRRIDVRADRRGWFRAVLPHELTHVIIADEFPAGEVPHWADEGMAMLADTPLKQSLHQHDFDQGRRGGMSFRLAHLVSQTCYPSAQQIPVFYGESVALVKFLVDRNSPAEFVRFLHRAADVGYDDAISEVYGFAGVAAMERAWHESFEAPRGVAAAGRGMPRPW